MFLEKFPYRVKFYTKVGNGGAERPGFIGLWKRVLKFDRPEGRRVLKFDGAFGPEGCGLPFGQYL